MARTTRTIEIARLNIAMHSPHPPAAYIDLFRTAYRRRRIVRLGKVYGAMFGSLYPLDRDQPEKGLTGELYRFLKLDPNEPWFNAATGEAATEDDTSAIVIPPHLLPHLQVIPFVFRTRGHRFFFVSRDRSETFGPRLAKKLLDQLFAEVVASGRFPEVDVTVEPEHDSLERILELPRLHRLHITLLRPNPPDDGEDEDLRWMQKLAGMGGGRYEVKLTAARNEQLAPDVDTVSMARAAAANGHVVGTGYEADGTKVTESTTDKPMITPAVVDSALETVGDVLEREALRG